MAIEMAALEMDRQPSESIKFALDSNCTDVTDCSRTIPNSVCVASVCKCAVGFGPSNDRKECRKSKRIGQPCHPTQNTCYLQKLNCDELSGVCKCAPGYHFDSLKNDCFWMYFCRDGLIFDQRTATCIKPSDFWFPTTNHNPKLSFITFILLVFCFIKVMRSNSPYPERRRRISATNMNRNSFDLLNTIINYENNQRYPIRGGGGGGQSAGQRPGAHHLRPPRDNDETNAELYDESLPPPAYEDIINDDLKTVTVEQPAVVGDENAAGDFELKELGQGGRRKLSNGPLPEESELSSPVDSLVESSSSGGSDTNLPNRHCPTDSSNLLVNGNGINSSTSDSSTGQPPDGRRSNQQQQQPNVIISQMPEQQQQRPPSQLNQSNEQLPTYEQAVRQGPPPV